MVLAGVSYLAGAFLNAAAANIAMLIVGRVLLGAGIGFANSVRAHRVTGEHLLLLLVIEERRTKEGSAG